LLFIINWEGVFLFKLNNDRSFILYTNTSRPGLAWLTPIYVERTQCANRQTVHLNAETAPIGAMLTKCSERACEV